MRNETLFLKRFVGSMRPRRLRTMAAFAEQELIIKGGPFPGRFRLSRQPYSRLLFAQIDSGRWRRHVITGPQQSGKTLCAFNTPALYHLFEFGETVIIGVPTLDIVRDKWESDLLPAIEATRFRDLMPSQGAGSRRGTPSLIQFRNGAAVRFMTGGGSDKTVAGFTSRVLVVSESDGMDMARENSREASRIQQLEGRLRAYTASATPPVEYLECTVSTNTGFTWRSYQSGTASSIAAACPHCRKYVSPERENLVGWDEAPDVVAAAEGAAFACPSCGELFTDEQRVEMNRACVLLHKGQKIDRRGRITGDVPRTDTLGFRWSAFWNLLTTPGHVAAEEWEAAKSEDRVNAEKALKQWVWAEAVEDDTIEETPITIGIVCGSATGYAGRCNGIPRLTVPDDTRCVTAFVDVGKRFLPWQIVAHREPPLGPHTVAYGWWETPKPDVVGEIVAIREGLRELRDHVEGLPLVREGGGPCDLRLGLVDAGNWNTLIYDFVIESGGIWRAAMGDSRYKQPPKRTVDRKPSPNGDRWYQSKQKHGGKAIWVINIDADAFKTRSHAAFIAQPQGEDGEPGEGAATLFGDLAKTHRQFAEELTAEVWQSEWKDGKGFAEGWKKIRRHNHQFDCHAGNLVAASICDESTRPTIRTGDWFAEQKRTR